MNFNPRSHGGSDGIPKPVVAIRVISIHAPTGGATPASIFHFQKTIFQSTLPRGERPFSRPSLIVSANFNPRSHGGSDYFH